MDRSMVEENGSSAIGDSLGGGGPNATGSAVGEAVPDGSGGRQSELISTSNNGSTDSSTAITVASTGEGGGGGGGGGGGPGSGKGGGTLPGGGLGALGSAGPANSSGAAGPEVTLIPAATVATAPGTNIVQLLSTTQSPGQAQSVIQQNQQSVIHTATGTAPIARSVLLVCNKPNSVIHTTTGNLQTIHIKPEPHLEPGSGSIMTDTNSDDTLSDEEASPKKRRDLLTRRPSYRKILSDLGGAEIANTPSDGSGLHTITTAGGGVVQYSQPPEGIYVPLMGGNVQLEDQSRKREMRLQKNREAARECRRKKKEYIKCLENRVAVLENQNKALIEELKSLKELYCQQKSD
uniref:BZIP domain-containing protein n=1 Tax=Anopheles dirus TaxID=7168 RepID=A0A182N0V8_9DIPT